MMNKGENRQINGTQPIWWDKECITAKNHKHFLLNKYRRTNTEIDRQEFLNAKRHFKYIINEKKKMQKDKNKDKLLKCKSNPKQFWRLVRTFINKKSMCDINAFVPIQTF